MYFWTITNAIRGNEGGFFSFGIFFSGYDIGEDVTIEDDICKSILEDIKDASFGAYIGEVDNILDSNLVTIKLNTLDLIAGTDLICLARRYGIDKNDREESLNRYIEDNTIVYNYLYKHPDQIHKVVNDYAYTKDWVTREKNIIDSLKTNFQTIIDDNMLILYDNNNFRYYLRILNIQDSIATAKVTGSIFPFATPKIGDKINIK